MINFNFIAKTVKNENISKFSTRSYFKHFSGSPCILVRGKEVEKKKKQKKKREKSRKERNLTSVEKSKLSAFFFKHILFIDLSCT